MEKKISIENIVSILHKECKIVGNTKNKYFTNFKSITEARDDSLVWVDPARADKKQLVQKTKSKIIICDNSIKHSESLKDKCLVVVKNPKLTFIKLISEITKEKNKVGIHPTAFIHPEAKIHKEAFVGPFTFVGKCTIGKGSEIHGNVFLYDNVHIGNNVIIQAGCIIGAEGLNITKDESGKWHQFPHLGGVIIEDNVRIDVMNHIDRGTLGNTIIGEGTMIDNCCYIAHNVRIGKGNIIIGHTMISGSVIIGKECWIGPGTTIRDGIKIGDKVFIGMGSLIVKNIEDKSSVMGSPSRPIRIYKKQLKCVKELMKDK